MLKSSCKIIPGIAPEGALNEDQPSPVIIKKKPSPQNSSNNLDEVKSDGSNEQSPTLLSKITTMFSSSFKFGGDFTDVESTSNTIDSSSVDRSSTKTESSTESMNSGASDTLTQQKGQSIIDKSVSTDTVDMNRFMSTESNLSHTPSTDLYAGLHVPSKDVQDLLYCPSVDHSEEFSSEKKADKNGIADLMKIDKAPSRDFFYKQHSMDILDDESSTATDDFNEQYVCSIARTQSMDFTDLAHMESIDLTNKHHHNPDFIELPPVYEDL